MRRSGIAHGQRNKAEQAETKDMWRRNTEGTLKETTKSNTGPRKKKV